MKISDKGLEYILSLGFKKETSSQGVFLIYEWEDVKYIAAPNAKVTFPEEYPNAVLITLTKEQYGLLLGHSSTENDKKHSPNNNELEELTQYYDKFIVLKFDNEKKNFYTFKNLTEENILNNFSSQVSEPNPLKIIHDTKKAFHGFYTPIENFNAVLDTCDISTESLWITAYPILDESNNIQGAMLGLNHNSELDNDVLYQFQKLNTIAEKTLLAQAS